MPEGGGGMSDDKIIKLVDELAVSLGLNKPGDRMPGLRFTWEQIVILDKIRIQERREAAVEIRKEADEWTDWPEKQAVMRETALMIDPDIKGDDDGS
jgi:hypothetical protein